MNVPEFINFDLVVVELKGPDYNLARESTINMSKLWDSDDMLIALKANGFRGYDPMSYYLTLVNVRRIPKEVMLHLAWLHLEIEISINGYVYPSPNLPRYRYYYKKTQIYSSKINEANEYNKHEIERCQKLNQIADWDAYFDDFYRQVTRDSWLRPKLIAKWDKVRKCKVVTEYPEFTVYSPSGKTWLEINSERDLNKISEPLYEPLIADEELIDLKLQYYDIYVPQMYIVKTAVKAYSSTGKFQGYTMPLEEISYWPEKEELQRHLYNAGKGNRIPNAVRRQCKAQEITGVPFWANICMIEAEFIETLSAEDKLLFKPLDIEICPICGNRYNVKYGCEDPETNEEHVMGLEFSHYSEYWLDKKADLDKYQDIGYEGIEGEEDLEIPEAEYDDDYED